MTESPKDQSAWWRNASELLCLLDRDGRVAAINPAWQATFGTAGTQILGRHPADLLHADDAPRAREKFDALHGGTPILALNARSRVAGGTWQWFSWTAVPDGDTVFCIVRIASGADAQTEATGHLHGEIRRHEEVLAILCHDLRNSLGALGNGTHLLLRAAPDAESAHVIRLMQDSVLRMAELIANVTDFANARLAGGIRVTLSATETLADALMLVVGETRLTAPGATITTRLDLARPVTCDAPRIAQLLSNLLTNAVIHGDRAEPVSLDAAAADGRLTLSVTNQGPPIPQDAMEFLFEPFFQHHKSAGQPGLGLGLYIAAAIARAHAGTLAVSSTADGTTFTLDIPA